jgi:hypothetical protein
VYPVAVVRRAFERLIVLRLAQEKFIEEFLHYKYKINGRGNLMI